MICAFVVGRIILPNREEINLMDVVGIYKDRGTNDYWVKFQSIPGLKPNKKRISGLTYEQVSIIKLAGNFRQYIHHLNSK